jgi:pimeloyl-ACP methyl ester carboxylesterase
MNNRKILWCLWCLTLLSAGAFAQDTGPDFKLDSLRSPLDGAMQPFYYYASDAGGPQPLVIVLHQWSSDYRVTENTLREQAKAKNWNYVFPNFRGPNNHPKACCSEYVISDIDQVIDWALQQLRVDRQKVYVVGASGGGYATLCAFMKSRHLIASFSAWVPITDLTQWYAESRKRKNKYALDILLCTGASGDALDEGKAKERSPMYWKTPVEKLKSTRLNLYTGIHDGHTGSVPVTHSLLFYNKVLRDMGVTDKRSYVSRSGINALRSRKPPATAALGKLGNRNILYRKAQDNMSLIVFEGGHEMLPEAALEGLDQ